MRTAQNPVTLVTFDRMVIEQLGLRDVAAHVQSVAQAAGLRPPYYFGSEVVARFLELRYDHPAGTDRLELFPNDPITRAEAAWSLARVMHFGSWNVAYAREALSAFALPHMSAAQLQALQIAVSRIGYPYVWGGTTDNTADGLEHGGFDCSGFAWRVFKLSGLPWGNEIQGRTAAEQAGEIPLSQRLRASQLEPGDLLFFGHAHFSSKATRAEHRPRGDLPRRQLGDPLLFPGRLRVAADGQLARQLVRLGTAGDPLAAPSRRRATCDAQVQTGRLRLRRGCRGRAP